jgi:hypothetical protein
MNNGGTVQMSNLGTKQMMRKNLVWIAALWGGMASELKGMNVSTEIGPASSVRNRLGSPSFENFIKQLDEAKVMIGLKQCSGLEAHVLNAIISGIGKGWTTDKVEKFVEEILTEWGSIPDDTEITSRAVKYSDNYVCREFDFSIEGKAFHAEEYCSGGTTATFDNVSLIISQV